MRKLCFWIAAWLALGLSACTTFRPPPLDPAKACANWRWIAIKSSPDAQCPAVPGWTVRPLFPQLDAVKNLTKDSCPQLAAGKGGPFPPPEVIQELNRFCVYETSATVKSLKDHPFQPPAGAGLERFDQDCAALSIPGEKDLQAKNWKLLSELFLTQAGLPGKPVTIKNPLGVRLSFLDTERTYEDIPKEEPIPGHSWHGYTLAHIARHLVCASESCAAQITTQLALPITYFDPKSWKDSHIDTRNGGFLGTQSDLADAITREVKAWHDNRWRRSQQHLVINLSLAWDSELFGGLHEERVSAMRTGTQAVFRALQYAAGFDALVVAAAGNRKAEPCGSFGLLLPAAWERAAPERCNGAPPPLYAVGGVSSDGYPLANARPGGMPSRAAYGESAVVASVDPEKPTAILTGSSVAATVVSSIAAVVWSSFPDHDSRWVMEKLEAGGDDLTSPADFWTPGGAAGQSKVHRLSLCTALKAACAADTSVPCPIPIELTCDRWRPAPFPFPSLADAKRSAPGSCQPWLYPQPEDDPCLSTKCSSSGKF
jgi:hypothetical protein